MNGFASAVALVALLHRLQAAPPPATPEPPAAPPAREPAAAAEPATRRPAPAGATLAPPATGTAAAPGAAAPGAAAPAPAPRVRVDPAVERADAERVARAFVDALAASDAGGLAAAASDRFSFDGDTVAGRDAIRSRWRSLLAARPGQPPRVGSVEVLPSADAIARLGKPPARIAPLARPGAWVALADLGGRPVVLFVAREAGRMAVLGMHD